MMWTRTKLMAVAAALTVAGAAWATPPGDGDEPDAEALVERAMARGQLGIRDGEATLQMVITDAQGRVLERTLRSRSQVVDGARRTRITFTEPADQRGVEVLLIEGEGGEEAQYLWLPRLGERRRIAGTSKSARFEGSDFTYADLAQRGGPEGARFERLPDETWGGQPVYRVDVLPGDAGATAGESEYGKVSLWIGKSVGIPLKVAFFDRRGRALKELRVKRVQKLGGGYAATHFVMRDVQDGSQTELRLLAHDGDRRSPPAVFSPEALGR